MANRKIRLLEFFGIEDFGNLAFLMSQDLIMVAGIDDLIRSFDD